MDIYNKPDNEAEERSDNREANQPFLKRAAIFVWEIAKIVVISLAIIIPIRMYVIQPFIVEGASMSPNFENGQYLIIDEISYRFAKPQRGDVVIFHPPADPKTYYIKRVIGLPGETVEMREGNFYIINNEYPDGFRLNEVNYLLNSQIMQTGQTVLKDAEYYLIGDNRDNSLDSRKFGPVSISQIKGKVLIRAFPFKDFNIFSRPVYNIAQPK